MQRTSKAFGCATALLLAVLITAPIVWAGLISIKTRVDALAMPPAWRFQPTLEHYRAVLSQGRELRTLVNSFVISSASTVLAMALAIPAAFSLSRFRFRGRGVLQTTLIGIRMVPAPVMALPLFVMFATLRILDTFTGIIIVQAALSSPIAIWLLKLSFDGVPTSIDDASRVDGDSWSRLLWRQIVPVALPGVLLATAFCFLNAWNEFALSMVLTGARTEPLTVAIPALVTPHGTYWGRVTAISSLALLPALLILSCSRLLLGRELSEGATSWR